MDISYFYGDNSSTFKDWCKKNYSSMNPLCINATWDQCSPSNTHFVLNGTDHPYTDFNKDLNIAAGTTVNLTLIGDSSAHVHVVDGVDVGYPIEYDVPEFVMPEGGKTTTVLFTPYFT